MSFDDGQFLSQVIVMGSLNAKPFDVLFLDEFNLTNCECCDCSTGAITAGEEINPKKILYPLA